MTKPDFIILKSTGKRRKKLVSLGDDEVLYEMLVIGTSLDVNVIQTDLSLYRKFVCVRSVGFWKF